MALPKATTVRKSPKPVTWTYSKLKNWRSCPRKHFEVDIAKTAKEDEDEDEGGNENLKYGNLVHELLARRIETGATIPEFHRPKLEPVAQKFLGPYPDAAAFREATGGVVLVEQKLAMTAEFGACGYFDSNVWHRSVCDALKIIGPVAFSADWKTGKIIEDSEQLLISAQCVFAHHPQVQKIRTMYVWLKEDAVTTVDVTREDMAGLWATLLPEIQTYTVAVREGRFPERPSGLCKRHCPVISCDHNGRR